MNRIVVHDEDHKVIGWFDLDAAQEVIGEDQTFNGNNWISAATGTQWDHEELVLTAGKRWVLHSWSQWQGSTPTWRFLSDTEAKEWLTTSAPSGTAEQFFSGEVEEEVGPGAGSTPLRNVRVDDATWERAKAAAAARSTTVSALVREALAQL